MSAPAAAPDDKVPISLLSGFLGSGKTTLLQELLTNKGGLRVGVVVNDVASVNIDAKLVRDRSSSGIRTKSGEGIEFVELENGCACCNASDELMACIAQLLEVAHVGGYKFDRIVIEMSGVAEPKNVRREFQEAMRGGHPVFDFVKLSAMITVVDSPHFFDLFSSKHDVADHVELLGLDEQKISHDEAYDVMKSVEVERKVVDLLVEQVECSNAIILNKIDRVSDDRRHPLREMMTALNGSAEVFECSFGKVPLEQVFGKQVHAIMMSDDDDDIRTAVKAAQGHGHGHSHAHSHGDAHAHAHAPHAHTPTAAEKYGISTMVYSARKPFHPGKLQKLIALLPVKAAVRDNWVDHMPVDAWSMTKLLEGNMIYPVGKESLATLHSVVRSKGFVWVANHPENALYWSHAGAHFALDILGMWWSGTAREKWPEGGQDSSGEVQKILGDFDATGAWGDRRQEIVLIGIGMDDQAITKLFDDALLTDEEMIQFHEYMAEKPDLTGIAPDPSTPSGLRLCAPVDRPVPSVN